MSKFHKSCLALAVAAAIPATGFAATLSPAAATPQLAIHAQEAVSAATSTASNASAVTYTLKAGDFLIGRDSGFKVEITLTGAEFSANTSAVTSSQTNWVTSSAGSSGALFSFSMIDDAAVAGTAPIAIGDLFAFAPGALDLTKLPTAGGTITAAVKIRDLATGLELMSTTGTVMTVDNGTVVSAKAASADKIDVTKGKMQFVTAAGANTTTVQLGTVTVGLADGDSKTAGTQAVSIEGSGRTANGDVGATFVDPIALAAGDKLALTVTAGDATAFKPITGDTTTNAAGIYVSTTPGACSSASTKLTASTTNPNQFTGSVTAVSGDFAVCGVVNGKTVIADKGFSVAGEIDFADTAMVDNALAATALATLSYNGPVVRINSFNPATNADQLSYLRISNTSSLAGKITVDGTCDTGVASKTPVSFNLDAGKSILLTSVDVEKGNATKGLSNGLGSCGGGKYRLTVTGEVGSMNVQNFLRNVTSAGMINTNVNNAD